MPSRAQDLAGLTAGKTASARDRLMTKGRGRTAFMRSIPFLLNALNPWCSDRCYFAEASTIAGSAFATPPAAFLEPRRSIPIASRDTEKLMAM